MLLKVALEFEHGNIIGFILYNYILKFVNSIYFAN